MGHFVFQLNDVKDKLEFPNLLWRLFLSQDSIKRICHCHALIAQQDNNAGFIRL